MKEKIKKILSDKFNLTLVIVQTIAIICLILIRLSIVFNIAFLFLEGLYFILWGVKIIKNTNMIKYREEYYSKIPYTKEQLEYLRKKDIMDRKSGKFMGWMFIILGILLLYLTVTAII